MENLDMKRKIKWKMRKDIVIISILVLCSCSSSRKTDSNDMMDNNQNANYSFPNFNFFNRTLNKDQLITLYKNVLFVGKKNIISAITSKWDPSFNVRAFTKKVCHNWKKYRTFDFDRDNLLLHWSIDRLKSKEMYENVARKSPSDDQSSDSELPLGCHFKDYDIQTSEVICSGKEIIKVPMFKLRHFDKLIFNNTSIQIVDKSVIMGLPMVSELTFSYGDLMKVDFDDLLKSQPVLEKLSIVHNCISSVSFSSFNIHGQDQNLMYLNFQNNMIIFLPEPTIGNDSTLLKLKSLNLNYNPMCVLPGDIFYPLRDSQVKSLYLKQSGIEEIGSPSLKNESSPLVYLPLLEHLDLSNNPYLTIAQLDKLLAPLVKGNLISLYLSSNYYIEVPTAALSHVQKTLEVLDLQGLSVRCLDGASFPVMPRLTKLNLQYSRISQIKVDTFNSLANLEVLLLEGNDLLTIPPGMALRQLKVLSLNNNPLLTNSKEESFKIINNTFSNFNNLEKIYFSDVPLRRIDNYIFRGLVSLDTLVLSRASLTDIEPYSFRYLGNLKTLDLSYNEISSIPEHFFYGLGSVTSIDLSHNIISFPTNRLSMTTYLFNLSRSANRSFPDLSDAPQLEVLNISWNNLHTLVPGMFDDLRHLQTLELGNNQLKSWTEPLFENNRDLTVIVLINNEIHRLTKSMISDFYKNNLTVDLRDNIFVCSCPLTSFYDELNETNFEGLNDYTCYFNRTTTVLLEVYIESFDQNNCTSRLEWYIPIRFNDPKEIFKNSVMIYGSIFIIGFITLVIGAAYSYRSRWYTKYWLYKVKFKNDLKPDSKSYTYDTFICYSQADQQWVFEKLVKRLESVESGLNVCVHERDFLVGEPITHNIVTSVEKSRKVIVVISKSFVQSTWCMVELQIASHKIIDEKKNKLILLFLEPIEIDKQPKQLRSLLKSRTYISWKHEEEGQKLFWTRLMKAIAKPTSLDSELVAKAYDQVLTIENYAATKQHQQAVNSHKDAAVNQVNQYNNDTQIATIDCLQNPGYTNNSYENSETSSIQNFIKVNNNDLNRSKIMFSEINYESTA